MTLTRSFFKKFIESAKKKQLEMEVPDFIYSIVHPNGNYTGFSGGNNLNEDTLFAIGSISKGFAATVIAQLVYKGLIGWQDSIKKHIQFKLPSDIDLTLEQLLGHINPLPEHSLTELSEFGDSLNELLDKLQFVKVKDKSNFSYQNILFAAVAQTVKSLTGLNYTDYLYQ